MMALSGSMTPLRCCSRSGTMSGLGGSGGRCAMLVTAPSAKPSLVEPARRLLLKSKVKEAGLGACVDDQAEAAGLSVPGEGAEQHGQAGVAEQRVALLLGLRLELEGADVEAVEVDVVDGAHGGRPGLGSAPSRAGHDRRHDSDSPARKRANAFGDRRGPQRHDFGLTIPHNAELRFPVPRLAGFASIVCLRHHSAEGVNNSMTPGSGLARRLTSPPLV